MMPYKMPQILDCDRLCRVVSFVLLEGFAASLTFEQRLDCKTPLG